MEKEFHDGFVRQRRSLNLVSLVLTILVFFGINGNEVRLGPGGGAGLTVDLLDTRIIYLGLYLMWGWFLFRYWQYASPVRADSQLDLDKVQLPRIGQCFRPLMKRKAKELYRQEAMQQYPEADEVRVTDIELTDYDRERWKRVSCDARSSTLLKNGGRETLLNILSIRVESTGWRLYWPLLKAITPVNIKHPYFTEYLSPFVFAALPLIAFAIRWESVLEAPVPDLVGMWRLWSP